jgi:3-methyl-2-oxobutanoate hydroxymethyltransferase
MKRIYTYGDQPALRNLTVADIQKNRALGRKMTQVSCRTEEESAAVAESGVDLIICAIEDYDQVRKGAPSTFITAVPRPAMFRTKDEILSVCIDVAGRGADAILIQRSVDVVEMLAKEGLAVQGHVGLVPPMSTRVGGLRTIGKTADEALELREKMRRLEDAGAYGCEVECVAEDALAELRKHTGLVLSSIGSGGAADIIFLFLSDLTGDVISPPRHAKSWANLLAIRQQLDAERRNALTAFINEVRGGTFPDRERSISMLEGERENLAKALARQS